jgi:hypothetical protein
MNKFAVDKITTIPTQVHIPVSLRAPLTQRMEKETSTTERATINFIFCILFPELNVTISCKFYEIETEQVSGKQRA